MIPTGRSSCQFGELPSFSFSGSGFLATYQLGVVQCFLNHAPSVLDEAPGVLGASAGSLVAAAVVCKVRPERVRDELLSFVRMIRRLTFGPLHPTVNVLHWVERMVRTILPHNAHQLANGRLGLAMTRIPDGQNTVVSNYESREDVVKALLCSCFLPLYCGTLPPSYKGVHYIDGGFTSIQPQQEVFSGCVLTVSPFAGEVDICPQDSGSSIHVVISGASFNLSLANSVRFINALYPHDFESLDKAYHSGYRDAIHFLHNSDLDLCFSLLKTPSNSCLALPLDEWIDLGTKWEEETSGETEIELEKTDRGEEEGGTDQEKRGGFNKKQRQEEGVEGSVLMTSMTENRERQRNYSPGVGASPWDLGTLKQALYLGLPTWSQTAMLCNVLIQLSTAELLWANFLMQLLSYLLLPLTLPLCFMLQQFQDMSSLGALLSKLGLWLSQVPTLVYWLWQDLRQLTFFFANILVSTIRINLEDRIDVQAKYEGPVVGPQGQWSSALILQVLSSSPPQDKFQYTALFQLDLEPGEAGAQRKSANAERWG